MPVKILFVCLGNICRSPLAEAIFIKKITERKLSKTFLAESCGTGNYHIGSSPDPRTIKNALENNVQLSHKGRQLSDEDLESFDHILAMDARNITSILRLEAAKKNRHKISLIRVYDPIVIGQDVPDPYHGTERDFQEVFDMLDRTIHELISRLCILYKADNN